MHPISESRCVWLAHEERHVKLLYATGYASECLRDTVRAVGFFIEFAGADGNSMKKNNSVMFLLYQHLI